MSKRTIADTFRDIQKKRDEDVASGVLVRDYSSPTTSRTSGNTAGGSSLTKNSLDDIFTTKGAQSARAIDYGGLYNMGGKDTGANKGSMVTELKQVPSAFATGVAESVEGIAKSPALLAAAALKERTQGTAISKRGLDSGASVAAAEKDRMEKSKQKNTVKKFADAADSLDVYSPDFSWSKREEELAGSSERQSKLVEKERSGRYGVNDFVAATNKKLTEYERTTGSSLTLGSIARTAGQMAPSQLAGAGASALGVSTELGSLSTMFGQVAGNSYDEARAQGASQDDAIDYAIGHAAIEVGTEMLGGGIPGMGEGVVTGTMSKWAKQLSAKNDAKSAATLASAMWRRTTDFLASDAGEMVTNILGEGMEEVLSELASPYVDRMTIDPNAPNASLEDCMLAFAGGVGTSLFMSALPMIRSAADNGYVHLYDEDTGDISRVSLTEFATRLSEERRAERVERLNAVRAARDLQTATKAAPAVSEGKLAQKVSSKEPAVNRRNETTSASVQSATRGAAAAEQSSAPAPIQSPASVTEASERSTTPVISADEVLIEAEERNKIFAVRALNKWLSTGFSGVADYFSERGVLYDRYGESVDALKAESKAAWLGDNLKHYSQYMPGLLTYTQGMSWDTIDSYFNEVVVPTQRAVTEHASMRGKANRVEDKLRDYAINAERIEPSWLTNRVVENAKRSNPSYRGMDDNAIRQQVAAELNEELAESPDKREEILKGKINIAAVERELATGEDRFSKLAKVLGSTPEVAAEAHNAYLRNKTVGNAYGTIPVQVDGRTRLMDFNQYLEYRGLRIQPNARTVDELDKSTKTELRERFVELREKSYEENRSFVSALNDRASKAGLKVLFDSKLGKSRYGEYDRNTRTIRINPLGLATQEQLAFVTAHELVHAAIDAQGNASENRQRFTSYIKNMADSIGYDFDGEIEQYAKLDGYKGYTQEQFKEEAAVRFVTELLGNSELLFELADKNESAILDLVDYLDTMAKQNPTDNVELRREDAKLRSKVKKAANHTLEAQEQRNAKPVVESLPPQGIAAAQVKAEAEENRAETVINKTIEERQSEAQTLDEEPLKVKAEASDEATGKSAEAAKILEKTQESIDEIFTKKAPEVKLSKKTEKTIKSLGFNRATKENSVERKRYEAANAEEKVKTKKKNASKESEAIDLSDEPTSVQFPGLPGIKVVFERTNGGIGTVLRAVAEDDGQRKVMKLSKRALPNDAEKKVLKAHQFKYDRYSESYIHDFTPEFWGYLKTASPRDFEGSQASGKSIAELYEYDTQMGDGSKALYIPDSGNGEIGIIFRDEFGYRRKSKGDSFTYTGRNGEGGLGFKRKNGPYGTMLLAPYSDSVWQTLGMPAMTRTMRDKYNLNAKIRFALYSNDGQTLPCTGPGLEGFDLGYSALTNLITLYKSDIPLYVAPFSTAIMEAAFATESPISSVFTEKSDAMQRVESIIKDVYADNAVRAFGANPRETGNESNNIKTIANVSNEEVNAEVEKLIKADSHRKGMVKVKYRGSDEYVYYPKAIAHELAGVTKNGALPDKGAMIDQSYVVNTDIENGFVDRAEDYKDPETGRIYRYHPSVVPETITDNDTGKTIFDATKYDATKRYPGEDIVIDKAWFKKNAEAARAQEREYDRIKKPITPEIETDETVDDTGAEHLGDSSLGALDEEYSASGERIDMGSGVGLASKELTERLSRSVDTEADTAGKQGAAGTGYTDSRFEGGYASRSSVKAIVSDEAARQRALARRDEYERARKEAIASGKQMKEDYEARQAQYQAQQAMGVSRKFANSYSMDELKQMYPGSSVETLTMLRQLGELTERREAAIAEHNREVSKALKAKIKECKEALTELRALDKKAAAASVTKPVAEILASKPKDKAGKKKRYTKTEDMPEGRIITPVIDEAAESGPGAKMGPEIDDADNLDLISGSRAVSNLIDNRGHILDDARSEFYRAHPGGLSEDGVLKTFYTGYDDNGLGGGLLVLYTEPNAETSNMSMPKSLAASLAMGSDSSALTSSDLREEPVYIAIDNPLRASDTFKDYPEAPYAVRSALEYLGVNPEDIGEAILGETSDPNTFITDYIMGVSNAIASTSSNVESGDLIAEILTQLGVDGMLLEDGAILLSDYGVESADYGVIESRDYNRTGSSVMRFVETDEDFDDWFRDYNGEGQNWQTDYEDIDELWDNAVKKYWTIEGTNIPYRVAYDGKRTSTSVATMMENARFVQPGTVLETAMRNVVLSGAASYAEVSDLKAKAKAEKYLFSFSDTTNNGKEFTSASFDRAYNHMMTKIQDEGLRSKEDVAKAGQILVELSNYIAKNEATVTDGQLQAWERLTGEIVASASSAGQTLQAFAMLRKLTPQGRLYYMSATIAKLRDALNNDTKLLRKKAQHALDDYEIPQDIIDEIDRLDKAGELDSKRLDEIEQLVIEDVASRIPPTLETRLNAWRHLCMLGNPKTHVRNIASNWVMSGVKDIARETSGLLQDVFRVNDKTVSVVSRADRLTVAFAVDDYARNIDVLQHGGKQGFETRVMQARKAFGNSIPGRAANWLSEHNSEMLELEDLAFLKREYVKSMSRYITANNLSVEQLSRASRLSNAQALEDLARAREYALTQAWEATYRQAGTLATKLNEIEKSSPVASLLVEGILPYKRTPINIMKAGVNYSPIGVLSGVYKLFSKMNGGGVTAAEVCDQMGKGLTGSGLMLLGYFLGSLGMAKAGGSDSDREEYYNQMIGEQQYSLSFKGKNFTIDWLTPVSMPLMAGVALAESQIADADRDPEDVEDASTKFNHFAGALSMTLDPLTNLSVLSNLNDVLTSYKNNQIGEVAKSAVMDYGLQFIPTMSGQALRTMDPTRRSTYAPSDSNYPFGKTGEQFVNKLRNKSLVANALLGDNAAYIDQWGRQETNDSNVVLRAFNQFVAPWYTRDYNSTAVDDKLAEVFAKNGEAAVLPASPQNSYTINKTRYVLKPDEYERVKTIVGSTSYSGLEKAMAYGPFNQLDTESQTKVIKNIYSYAREVAKLDYAEFNGIDYARSSEIEKIEGLAQLGIDVGQYYTIKALIADLKGEDKKSRLRALDLPYEVRQIFY